MIAKSSIVKLQNLVVNHELRPVKSNSDSYNSLPLENLANPPVLLAELAKVRP